MATKLMVHFEIDALIPQIEASWNKWAKTKEAREQFEGRTPPTTFAKDETPWTTKQSVLERNYFWANKLIALYIELNVDVADRWPVWKFFEIRPSGVISCVKDQISRLKHAEKAIKTAKKLAVKAGKQAAKIAAKNIAKVEKAKAKAIAKEAAQRKKWLAKIDAQNYRIQFDRENSSIETLKKICREIPSCKAADKKLDKQRVKEETRRAALLQKDLIKTNKAQTKVDKTIGALEKKLDSLMKWCGNNGVPMTDVIAMIKIKM